MKLVISDEMKATEQQAAVIRKLDSAPAAKSADPLNRRLCACGKMFTPYRSFQRYCCEEHRVKYGQGKTSSYIKKTQTRRVCKECGKDFWSNDAKRHYCSRDCYLAYQLKRRAEPETRRCLVCNKEFVTTHWSKRYCSEACRMEARHT